MRLQKVSLQNFRCFEQYEVEFSPQFNVIIGNNGTGKSSLLEGLCMVLSAFFGGLDEVSPRKFQNNDVRYINLDKSPVYYYPVGFIAQGTVNQQEIIWSASTNKIGKNRKNTHKGTSTIKKIATELQNNIRKGKKVELPVIVYFGANRFWGTYDRENEKEEFASVENLSRLGLYQYSFRKTANYVRVKEWFKSKEIAAIQAIQLGEPELIEAKIVKKAVISCIENCANIYYNWDTAALVMKMSDGRVIRWNNLSDGQRAILAVVAEIAYTCISLNPHLGENALESSGVVLIDELDMHLHPKWQRRIVSDLKRTFPNIQFIVTTHSPFIVQGLKKEELINLEPNNSDLELDPYRYGIEDVVESEMGMENLERSMIFKERVDVATMYYKLISEGKNSKDNEEVAQLREKLNELEERFSEDPAFVALLKAERKSSKL